MLSCTALSKSKMALGPCYFKISKIKHTVWFSEQYLGFLRWKSNLSWEPKPPTFVFRLQSRQITRSFHGSTFIFVLSSCPSLLHLSFFFLLFHLLFSPTHIVILFLLSLFLLSLSQEGHFCNAWAVDGYTCRRETNVWAWIRSFI